MKRLILFGLSVCAVHISSHSQSNPTQLPNGVIVHQAQGVEGVVEPTKNEPAKPRSVQEWSLAECIDALSFVMIKLNESSDADRERYLETKAQIEQRINELKPTN